MLKKYLYFPLSAGVFAAFVTVAYSFAYESATAIEGKQLESLRDAIPMMHLVLVPIIACFVAAVGYFTLKNFLPKAGPFIFYFLFSSFSIFTSFAIFKVYGLHEEIIYTVYGYAMPMHFFPFLSWVSFKSLFFQD
jgi:hypothetical protein